jgi:MFS family permease
MNIKKFAIGTIVGGVLFFLLGWLIFGILLNSYMHSHGAGPIGHRADRGPVWLYLIAAQFVFAALYTFIFLKANVKGWMEGLIAGGIIGGLSTAAFDFMTYSFTTLLSKKGYTVDIIASAVMAAIVGAVLGVVLGGKKE